MFARLEPCASRRADGLVCEAAATAPPPPPGSTDSHWRDPAPPPPPSIHGRSLRMFVDKEVRPRTRAICSEATEGRTHREACLEMAQMLSTWRISGFISGLVGFCEPSACWHSCDGTSSTDPDGFGDCKFAECADAPCLDFLLRECEEQLHPEMHRLYDGACKLVPPSPPSPPSPPPSPPYSPPPPGAPPPPPFVLFTQREAATERTWDVDCEPVSYDDCRVIQEEYSMSNLGSPRQVAATLATCEGAEGEQHCFRGCAYGGAQGAIYTFLLERHEAELGPNNPKRCATSLLPYCACKQAPPPPPAARPPPPGHLDIQDYKFVPGVPGADGTLAYNGAFIKALAFGRKLPQTMISSSHRFGCAGSQGHDECARTCADEHLGFLRAIAVTGRAAPPMPPPPNPPPSPPPTPPLPSNPPLNFNACNNECETANDGLCTDGGYRSLYPPSCDYSYAEVFKHIHSLTFDSYNCTLWQVRLWRLRAARVRHGAVRQ